MKQLFMLATGLGISIAGMAQRISGQVLDASDRHPLVGATIIFSQGQTISTDAQGRFSIPCDEKGKIRISYTGFRVFEASSLPCDKDNLILLSSLNEQLNEIEITATSSQSRSQLTQPASIAKLQRRELTRGTGLTLDDAVNTSIPGVFMQRRSVGGGQQFNIRGYGNGVRGTNGISSNFDGQGSKVYLNGIPVTDAEGITVLDDIDFGSLGNVEIIKGPSGSLYGLAIAGVVNLHTKEVQPGTTALGQEVIAGSYGLRRHTTQFETANENTSLLLNYGVQQSDGYMKHTTSNKKFLNAAIRAQIGSRQSISGYFGHSSSYDERGGELTIVQYSRGDYSGNPEYIKRNAHSEVISFRAGLSHTYRINEQWNLVNAVFGTGMTTNASSAGGWTDKNPLNFGLRSTVESRLKLGNFSLNGITGVETQQAYAQTIGYNMVQNPIDSTGYWVIGAMRSNQSTYSGTVSVFSEWTLLLPKDLSITAGLGWSNMKIELNDKFYVAGNRNPTQFTKTYSGMFAPHLAINKVFSQQVSVYASYRTGYKAPVSSYFFIPTTGEVNKDLKAEKGEQFELGSKGVSGRLSYNLAVFFARFKDKMTAVAVPLSGSTTTTAYSYIVNGGSQEHKGLELTLRYQLAGKEGFFTDLSPFFNFAFSDFKYRDFKFQTLNSARTGIVETDFSGKAVAGVPPVTLATGIDFNTVPGVYGNVVYYYRDRQPISSTGVYKADRYYLLNAKLGWRKEIGRVSINAYAGINNITGQRHYLMTFSNQLPDAYLPGPGDANFFGGVGMRYFFRR